MFGCGPEEAALVREIAPRHGVRPTVTAAPVSEETCDLVAGNHCISVNHKTRITNPTLRALSRAGVRYISTRSVGYNHLDPDYARSVGICVGNVAYSPDSVADYTLMLMLMAVRNAKTTVLRAQRHDYRLNAVRGKELRDLTVGVVGTGRIGTAVVNRLRGFGSRVVTHDVRGGSPGDHVPLDEVLRRSDVVTLHVPLTPRTHHLLDERRLGTMKTGAFLVNTARGPLVDTAALVAALENGHLGGAALDVVEGEEGIFYTDCGDRALENSLLSRLQRFPTVLITPHTAYDTDHALRDMVENSIVNCLEFESRMQHG